MVNNSKYSEQTIDVDPLSGFIVVGTGTLLCVPLFHAIV